MPEVNGKNDDRPLHEKVFQIRAAIRRAGFVASGRTRIDKDGRVVMGVIVPVAFPAGNLTVEDVRGALLKKVVDLPSITKITIDEEVPDNAFVKVDDIRRVFCSTPSGRPPDLRAVEGKVPPPLYSQITVNERGFPVQGKMDMRSKEGRRWKREHAGV